jgi:hypothetical protein
LKVAEAAKRNDFRLAHRKSTAHAANRRLKRFTRWREQDLLALRWRSRLSLVCQPLRGFLAVLGANV